MKKRTDKEIISEIQDCYGNLSPENLFWDGERSQEDAQEDRGKLTRKLEDLFKELGRHITESQAYGME